jgi:UDP:flavonoid glycosyltransferase YjiC (YdhE family)
LVKFICSTFGSAGDVFPILGLALELRGRGHDVVFATNERFGALARKYGLPFQALGTSEEFDAAIQNPELWQPRRAFRYVFETLQPIQRQQYDFYARHTAGNAVGISNCLGLGALLAQEKLNMPLVTVHCQPAVIWSDIEPPHLPGIFGPLWLKSWLYRIAERIVIDPLICPFLNRWRAELGLPPVRRITRWWNSPYAVLCLFPDWYCRPQADWPANIIQTDFPLWNAETDVGLSTEVTTFLAQGEPPLVFTPGSANVHGEQFFATALEACKQLDRRAIFLTDYPGQLPKPMPVTVAHFRYVPLDLLLPRASVFIHHGGVGSTSQGLAAGIPQVVVPLAHDQFDNAERVQRLGAGDWVATKRFTGRRLSALLQKLLTSQEVAKSCRQLAKKLECSDGLARAAEAIEQRSRKCTK